MFFVLFQREIHNLSLKSMSNPYYTGPPPHYVPGHGPLPGYGMHVPMPSASFTMYPPHQPNGTSLAPNVTPPAPSPSKFDVNANDLKEAKEKIEKLEAKINKLETEFSTQTNNYFLLSNEVATVLKLLKEMNEKPSEPVKFNESPNPYASVNPYGYPYGTYYYQQPQIAPHQFPMPNHQEQPNPEKPL
jgi:hypothetical protein